MKKLLSCLLALALVLSCICVPSLQANAATVAGGTCGDNLTWILDDAGTLTISGTGDMYDYGYESDAPWYNYCETVQNAVIQPGVTAIGDCAFNSCYELETVTIPDSVTIIGEDAFSWCENLTSVTIPASVTEIGDYAFDYCMNLEGIWVDEENPAYSSDESGVLFSKEKNILIKAPGALAGAYTVPDGVITIQDWAFEWCFNLTSVSFPKSLLTFGSYAFDGCHGLEKFWVDEQNPVYSSDEKGVVFNKEKTVLIKVPNFLPGEYTVPAGVTEIAPDAFVGNNEVLSVVLQPGVEKIGEGAFSWCGNLMSVTIPKSVTEIGYGAFSWSEYLTDVYYAGTREQWEQISIGEDNSYLLNANIHYAGEVAPGDLDGVEGVDEDDVIYLLQHLLMPEDFPVAQTVDYDRNNAIDEDDVIYLLQHLLMPDDFPLTDDSDDEEEPQEVMTHAQYVEASIGSFVTVECYVQACQSWWEDQIVVYAQDRDGGYLLYGVACSEEDAEKLTAGTKIRASGWKQDWCGLVEIVDGTFEFVEDGDTFIAEPRDVTDLLGTEELIQHQNEKVCFKGMTVVACNPNGDPFQYRWDGTGEPGDDIYFVASIDGKNQIFCIERYLTEDGTDVYETVEALKVGDVIDLEGFLYWYESAEPHITSVTVVS